MSGRSTDRVGGPSHSRPGETATAAPFDDGRLASETRRRSSTYLTADRLALIEASLTATDWALLMTVATVGFVTGPQLTRIHYGEAPANERAARRALARLRQLQLVDVLDRRIGGVRAGSSGFVYRLGLAGARLLTGRRRPHDEPGQHHLAHALAVAEVLVILRQAERAGAVAGVEFEAEPASWRRYTGHHGEPAVLKPDAYVELFVGTRRRLWFVEVDRGTVSTATLKQQMARYGEYLDTGLEEQRHGVFPRVVWTTATKRRADHLRMLCSAENHRIGAELHRLLDGEWQPPPAVR